MAERSTLAIFIIAVVALVVVPGPVMLYTVARSVEQGRAAQISACVATVGRIRARLVVGAGFRLTTPSMCIGNLPASPSRLPVLSILFILSSSSPSTPISGNAHR
jgi:hypothetical protein